MPAVETDWRGRDQVRDEIVLRMLDAVENDPVISQRSVANELGIALGLVNAYLRRCVRKGLIKVGQIPRRRYAYYLTPKGFAEKSRLTARYLSQSFAFFRRARAECATLFTDTLAKGQRRFVLIGDGELSEIAMLVAREFPVEIVGIVKASEDAAQLKSEVCKLGPFDAIIVTSLVGPREVFRASKEAFGATPVHAPALLRVRVPETVP